MKIKGSVRARKRRHAAFLAGNLAGKYISCFIRTIKKAASRNNPLIRRTVSILLCISMVMAALNGIGSWLALAADDDGTVIWGSVEGVEAKDEGGVHTWDVSETTRRYVYIPVMINTSDTEDLEVTLPKYINGNLRTGTNDVEINTAGVAAANWTLREDTSAGKQVIVITHTKSNEGGQHASVSVIYRFDCWNVVSGNNFEIPYTVKKGGEWTQQGTLTGKIITGHGVEFDNYINQWNNSDYSLSAFAGADREKAFLQNWSTVLQKYFGLEQSQFSSDYLYDIAPFLVKPTGQQPYDISGTLTLSQGGEVTGAVYMMDSVKGSDAPWKKLRGETKDGGYQFTFNHDDTFENEKTDFTESYGHDIDKLRDAVVTGNLSDTVDNKNYTLYFLVRYKKSDLRSNGNQQGSSVIIDLNAKLSITHTGVDNKTPVKAQNDKTQTLYHGALDVSQQIYFACYVNSAINNRKALTALEKGMPVNLDFAVDFFCMNEARKAEDKGDNKKYALEAIIDLSYITGGETDGPKLQENAKQLQVGDYRFSAVDITLVDAPGSWSQDWEYIQDNANGGWAGTPHSGWTLDTWNNETLASNCDVITVYGSTSLTENNWDATPVTTFTAKDVWALNQDRNFRTGQGNTTEFAIPKEKNYVRLKVVYNSQNTTALRVGYQLELQPGIVNKNEYEELLKINYDDNGNIKPQMTCWFNYMGYKNGIIAAENADTTYMNFQRFPYSDAGWNSTEAGTSELARKYDKELSDVTGYNKLTGDWDSGYSLRNFAKASLGRFDESAGMLITQALYDSTGKLVGDPDSIDLNTQDSYALKDSVINVSEIVFNISGVLTDGSSNTQELQEYKDWLNDPDNQTLINSNSELKNKKALYNSTKMRYFVLLPPGMKLNLDPDEGNQEDENQYPKFHFWTKGTDRYLSASSSFYNNNSTKVVQGGATDVPVSKSNIPGWSRVSANAMLSEMYWVAGEKDDNQNQNDNWGGATVFNNTEENQLVVFERKLSPEALNERFNMWGTSETYFWGRGLSFSIVPDGGTGRLPAGSYTTYVWCQYLDENNEPIKIDGFRTGTFNKNTDGGIKNDTVDENNNEVNEKLLEDSGGGSQNRDTLLYIPIDFKNRSGSGSTYANISLESDAKDGNGSPVVQFGKEYAYRLEYGVNDRTSNNVVLWTNIEKQAGENPWYQGIVTGVDLSKLPAEVQSKVRVYVRKEHFDAGIYTLPAAPAGKDWLLNRKDEWTEVPDIGNYPDWAGVKAIAFYFEDQEFNALSGIDLATVKIKMRAPLRGEFSLPGGHEEITYMAVSPLIFSDSHRTEDNTANACTPANEVPVSVTIRSLTLPSTGGYGAGPWIKYGLLLFLAGIMAILLWMRRMRVRHERNGPYLM